MKAFLEVLLPGILPKEIYYQLIPHQGKSDLINSIPRKLRAIREPGSRFIILHDQDAHDCVELKNELLLLTSFRADDVLIRIVCCELESWFLGDFDALKGVYPQINWSLYRDKSKFREPDKLRNAKQELKTLVSNSYQAISHAALIAEQMVLQQNFDINKSTSFQYFLNGLKRMSQETVSRPNNSD